MVARFPAAVTAHAMTRVSGGRVAVVGGTGQFYVQHEFAVARFTASGRVDRTFGGGRTCGEVEGFGLDDAATAVLPLSDGGMLVGGSSQSDADSLTFARYRPTFTAGGVECFEPEELLGPQPLRSVALPVILGRRGRIALLVRSGGYASAGRFRRVCLGTHGPGNVTLHWDGRIAGRRLRPGPYALVLESRDRRGHLIGRSYLRAIGLPRRASGPRRTHAC